MKKPIFIILFYFSFFQNVFSQINKNIDIPEAINYLNLFLSDKHPFATISGGFTYNIYDKTLAYKCNYIFNSGTNQTLDVNYIISINNVLSIKETVLKYKDYNSVAYNLYLNNEIYKTIYSKKISDITPDYKNQKVKEVGFSTEKKLTDQDVENIKIILRNIFKNIPINSIIINQN